MFALTNPDGTIVPAIPPTPASDPSRSRSPFTALPPSAATPAFTANFQYMIPIYGRTVGFNIFDDFGMDVALRDSQLRQSPEGIDALDSPLYGCPNYVNGTCQGGQQIKFSPTINPIPGTNYVPRDSAAASSTS